MKNVFSKFKSSLFKTSSSLSLKFKKALSLNRPKEELINEIEEILISSDIGIKSTEKISAQLQKISFDQEINLELISGYVKKEAESILAPFEGKLRIDSKKPYTILFSGCNGSGKTTSLGKIAYQLKNEGKKVLICAADTFRAAASEQLYSWSQKASCDIMQKERSDPASLVYQSMDKAIKEGYDVLLIDTAGRIHNRADLMAELKKISKVLQKFDENAPNLNLLVIDGTIGQTALQQVKTFKEVTDINGLIVTKMDGSSKAGILLPLTENFQLPIYYIGTGESIEDLRSFSAYDFAQSIC